VYEYLDGQVAEHRPTRLVLDVAGVGYDLVVPLGAGFPERGRTRAWTHLVVRDDAQFLCGFADRATRDLFRLLLSVRGVGVSMAIGILSGLPRTALVQAIQDEDVASLMRVKGVGKKTAEQILLDLRERAARFARGSERDGTIVPRGTPAERSIDDAVRALVSIGYSEKEAQRSVEEASRRVDPEDLELLVRAALKG
jgi:Holliday junction DNA helicase RuvA